MGIAIISGVKQNLGLFQSCSYFCSISAQNMQIVLFSILMIKTFFWRNIQNKFEFETFLCLQRKGRQGIMEWASVGKIIANYTAH